MKKQPERAAALAKQAKTRDKVAALIKRWIGDLWLGQWEIDVTYEWNGVRGKEAVYARCHADWRYMHARITCDLPLMADLSDEDLEEVVVHELLHAVVNEMRSKGLPHEERVVSHLERVICYLARRRPTPVKKRRRA